MVLPKFGRTALELFLAISTVLTSVDGNEYDNNRSVSESDNSAACRLASGANSYAPYRITAKTYTPGRLRSPNFGNGRFYPPNSLCRWTIVAPAGHVIFLNFSTMRIDATPPPTSNRGRNAVPLGQAAVGGIPISSLNIAPGLASDIIRLQNNAIYGAGRSSSMLLPAVDMGLSGADATSGCEGDYLEVLDGTDYRQRHQLIGRYCTDSPPRPIVSVYNEVQVVFQSDGFKEDTGFELDFTAVSPNDVAIGRDGRLHIQSIEDMDSEDDSGEFDDDNNEINPLGSRYELLDFPVSGPAYDNAMMRPSSNLFLFGGGQENGKKTKATSRAASRSNGAVETSSCSKGAAILTQSQGKFSSPNFGSGQYPPGSHCEWLITAPRDRVIMFEFEELRLEYGLETRGCTFDYVEIFDGRDPTAPVLGRFCGRALPKVPIRSSSNYLFVVFQSDLSREDFGFSASYQMVSASPGCDGTVYELTGKSGEISSPNFGYGSYPSNAECRWTIRVPESFYVSLSFIDFDIESHEQQPAFGNGLNSPNNNNINGMSGHRRCSYDFLEIFDGPSPDDASSYGRYCGTARPGNMPATIKATQNTLSLVFRTDFSGERRGFRLQYTAILPYPGCEGEPQVLRDRNGEITSPNFGQDSYPPNSNCMWIVDPGLDHAALITVSFMHFQVEGRYASSSNQVTCPYDFVEIGLAASQEGYSIPSSDDESLQIGSLEKFGSMISDNLDVVSASVTANGHRRLCGQSLPAPFTLRGRRLRVRFHSDFNKQDAGFWLRFEIHEASYHGLDHSDILTSAFKAKLNKKKLIEHHLANILRVPKTTVADVSISTTEMPISNTEEPKTTAPPSTVTTSNATTFELFTEKLVTGDFITEELSTPAKRLSSTSEPATSTFEATSAHIALETTTESVDPIAMFSAMTTTLEPPTSLDQSKENMGIENGEFMLVIDEDLAQQKQHKLKEQHPTTEAPVTEHPQAAVHVTDYGTSHEENSADFGGIIIDESFTSGDGEYMLLNGEEQEENEGTSDEHSTEMDLKSLLFDPMPQKSTMGELVPLDPLSLQPSVNVTLLSFLEAGPPQSSSTSMHDDSLETVISENNQSSASQSDHHPLELVNTETTK